MTPRGYTEDDLIEQPAIDLLDELGWEPVNAYHEFDCKDSPLGRETKSEVVLKTRLWKALEKLNDGVSTEAIGQSIDELLRDRSRMSLAAANREIYNLIKDGILTNTVDPETGEDQYCRIKVIDWDNPANNDFLLCSQFWITGEMHTRRTDLVGFVNGLPLLFIELKAAHRRLETAYNNNLRDYKDTIPQLFWYNALIILSNGSQSAVGSITAGREHFSDWKKIDSEKEKGRISLETMLRGVCEPTKFIDLFENFILFQETKAGLIKLTAKNHQYLGVNNAMLALSDVKDREGKLGVFWHTQGSGKSISMMFFSQKVMRKVPGNWTFVLVTDRQELDGQIYKHFASAGIVSEGHAQATSSKHLRQLLKEDHRFIFTLIHKFRTENGEAHPVLSERSDVIIITDEAHRSQYDTMALNMRTALPNAGFLAFTGTPLIVGEEKTRKVFGEYISVYDFKQSVTDGATVPLYYENRIPELQLVNQNLNEDIERLLEEAELNEAQEKKLEREFSKEYHLITRDDRLETIAQDVVTHFTERGFQGKAMMICIDKATAIRMYNKVQKKWQDKIANLHTQQKHAIDDEQNEIEAKILRMKQADMAVVVSQGQNEIADMREKGLDIAPHRKRMISEDLETKFKDPKDSLCLVFVCAMWMTGFDVPSCSTLYLDKPMRNHTLMQTIARANRVYPGKVNGLIVDYAGVFRNLEKALAIYGAGGEGEKPVEDKTALVAALRDSLSEVTALCNEKGVNLKAIQISKGFERVGLLDDAVESLVESEETKRKYLDLANTVDRLFKAVLPDITATEFTPQVSPIHIIAEKLRILIPPADISQVMAAIEDLLDHSIASEGYIIPEKTGPEHEKWLDLSEIDFEALAEKFKTSRKRTFNERLKASVASKMMSMVRLNRTRMDYLDKFQKMIDEYNAGSLNAEELFKQLTSFAKNLNIEEQRAVQENMTEEELVIFDLLTKPEIEMTEADRKKVKATARELLLTLKKNKLVLDWRKHQQSRAEVLVTIEKILDGGLPKVYTPSLFESKSAAVFEHFYDAYYGDGRSVYANEVI
ncbi:MAG: type I restriction endonuclease subunit R [Deltaproteobacteria bacterium]|nr:type I restriction endonuclease subunit R [Deltaproteobacteria bacterium]